MSGELSNIQRNSLAGQILSKLQTTDDGKISRQSWNSLWDSNNLADYKGRPESNEEDGEDIDIQQAFKYIMTRIFNAAKAAISSEAWNENGADKNNAINEVAKDWLEKIDSSSDSQRTDGAKGADGASTAEETKTPAQQALENASAKIREISTATGAISDAINSVNSDLDAAQNAEAKEEADAEISKAESKINEISTKIQEIERKIAEAQKLLESAKDEEGYNAAKSALETATQAIGSSNTQLESLNQRLKELKQAAANKPTQKVVNKQKSLATLNSKGAKLEDERFINGTKLKYYKYKEDGETVRAIIDEDTGNIDPLIQISSGGKKHFITVSQLQKATNSTITQLPKDIKCECCVGDNGEVTLTFKDKKGQPVEAKDIPKLVEGKTDKEVKKDKDVAKNPEVQTPATPTQVVTSSKVQSTPQKAVTPIPAATVDDAFRAQLKDVKTGVKGLTSNDYTIFDDGAVRIHPDSINKANVNESILSRIKHRIKPDNGKYCKGPIKGNTEARVNSQYDSYVKQLCIKTEIYKTLANKTEALSNGEQKFMEAFEKEIHDFIYSYNN